MPQTKQYVIVLQTVENKMVVVGDQKGHAMSGRAANILKRRYEQSTFRLAAVSAMPIFPLSIENVPIARPKEKKESSR